MSKGTYSRTSNHINGVNYVQRNKKSVKLLSDFNAEEKKRKEKLQNRPPLNKTKNKRINQDYLRDSNIKSHPSPQKKIGEKKKKRKPETKKNIEKKQQNQHNGFAKVQQIKEQNKKIIEEQLLSEISPRYSPILKKLQKIRNTESVQQIKVHEEQKEQRSRIYSPKQQLFKSLSQGNHLVDEIGIILTTKNKQIDQIQQQKSKFKSQLDKLRNTPANKTNHTSKLFLANILQQQDQYQQYLQMVLSKTFGKIKSTKLIYQWQPQHKLNIHELVDNIPNLVFIILTEEGYYFAAFTEQPFKKPFTERGYGAIVSLTSRKVYEVQPQKHAISYDSTYIIFGNSQIMIKREEVTSNFGKAGGYYPSRGQTVDILFGQGLKSVAKIKQMQIFQLKH